MAYADPAKQREYCRAHYRKNKEYYLDKNRARKNTIRAMMLELKRKPCSDCRRKYPSFIMDFDHRPGTKKLYQPIRLPARGGLEFCKRELAKCDLVCANCHRIRTYNRAEEQKRSKNLAPPCRRRAKSLKSWRSRQNSNLRPTA